MKTNQLLLLAGVGVLAYMWWKKRNGTSNATGQRSKKENPCESIVVYDCPGRIGQATHLVKVGGGCACPTELERF